MSLEPFCYIVYFLRLRDILQLQDLTLEAALCYDKDVAGKL